MFQILYTLLSSTQASIDFSSTTFPFPSDSLTSQSTNIDSPPGPCSYDLIGDGQCDLTNNNQDCNYDGGDCCRYTCESNCNNTTCPFTCGVSGYNCLVDTSCSNCIHGTCNPMSKCFSDVSSVLLGIINCERNNSAHGNSSTADFFCGKDPNKTMVHSFDQFGFHYPGCGFIQPICTAYQCCTDLSLNNLTSTNCTNTPQQLLSYNKDTLSVRTVNSSCLSLFQSCFLNDSRLSNGQCCECEEGWVGKDCDIPTCFPPCANGICTAVDTCECNPGWSAGDCSSAVCSNCKNGQCIEPEVCSCDYGWNETACDVPYATPACVYGLALQPDICKCVSGYTGARCEIPVCAQCNNGWCVNPNVCECYPPYYTKDPSVAWCSDLRCEEIFGENCENCTNSSCTRCRVGYFLSGSLCVECQSFNVHCVQCNVSQCTLCAWPYVAGGFDCVFGGFLEFSSKYFAVFKSDGTAEISLFRIGPSVIRVEVSFKLVQIMGKFTGNADLAYVEGTLYFDPGVSVQKIVVPVYNKFFDSTDPVNFYFILYDPVAGMFFSQNLTTIADFTWSDKGIQVLSYCVVEIWDDPAQALPALTSFSQDYPSTVSTISGYNFTFFAYNSVKTITPFATFIVQVRQITLLNLVGSCLFSTYSFSGPSTVYTHTKVIGNGFGYSQMFYLPRGVFTLTPFVALFGCYVKIYTNLFLQGTPVEEGIRQVPGWYNNYTMPLGNSSSSWEFVYIPNDTFNGSLVINCTDTDLINVTINEIFLTSCSGSCSSTPIPLTNNTGYFILISYFHHQTSPGFTLLFQSNSISYPLTETYAVNKTSVSSQLFVTNPNEC